MKYRINQSKVHRPSSTTEEIIASLALIAGLLAWSNEIYWLAWLLFLKAALDTICSLAAAVRKIKAALEPVDESKEARA